jgi:hypothetical protein
LGANLNLNEEIETINDFIRAGLGHRARRALRQVAGRKIPREKVREVANLARRANLLGLALRLLNPVVRPTGKALRVATDAEKAEYAASLTYVGASEEALTILRGINPRTVPDALLFQAFALFSQWDYAGAIPLLNAYLQTPGLGAYALLVGKLNLLAALVDERRHVEAENVSKEILQETEGKGFDFVRGSAWELAAQHYLFQRQWEKTEECLRQAEAILQESESLERFYVTKWTAILHFLRSGASPIALRRLEQVQEQARRLQHWETVRDCDRVIATSCQDSSLLTHVYFGTPYASLRRHLLDEYGQTVALPSSYVWQLDARRAADVTLDAFLGEGPKHRRLKSGQLLHRLLKTLTSDFYRPVRVASAHFQLYPDDYFNPVSSPARVHEAVRRLRHWFQNERMPLTIDELGGFYRLRALGPCAVRVQREVVEPPWVARLRAQWGEKSFSAPDAEKTLRMTGRSVRRLLKEGLERGFLTRQGNGPATRYALPPRIPTTTPVPLKIAVNG